MPYIPAPTPRTAIFQGEIDVNFGDPITTVTRAYPIDFEQGQSGYSMIFDTEFRRALYGAGGSVPPTGISISSYAANIETLFQDIPVGDTTINTLPQRVGFWDNTLYSLSSTNTANGIVDYYSFRGAVNVQSGGTVDPSFSVNTDTLVYGAGVDVVFVLFGAARVFGGTSDNPRLANISYSNWIDGPNRRADFYAIVITNIGVDRYNAFSLVNDTSSFTSEENSPVTTFSSGLNWSYHPDQNENLHLLISWNEQVYDYQGSFSQTVYSLSLSDPADDAIFQTFFSVYDFYFNPCRDGFIFTFSDWSTGEYYFYKLSADGTQYWRLNVSLPVGYNGTPAMMQDDLDAYVMSDDLLNLFYLYSASVPSPPRFYPVFKVNNMVFGPNYKKD